MRERGEIGVGSVQAKDGTHYAIEVIPWAHLITIGGKIELSPLAARALARLLELAADVAEKEVP